MPDVDFKEFCAKVCVSSDPQRDAGGYFSKGLVATGKGVLGFCPFCQNDKSSSRKLEFYKPNNNWKCHKGGDSRCERGGNFIAFFVANGESFRDAATRLANQYGIDIPSSWRQRDEFSHHEKNDREKGARLGGVDNDIAYNATSKVSLIRQLPKAVQYNETESLRLMRNIYSRLTINEKDERDLFEKRGLESATVNALGFRSSSQANKGIIIEESKNVSPIGMVDSGFFNWRQGNRNGTNINKQFLGFGFAGKYLDAKSGEKKEKWDWVFPILIPYFNSSGDLISIRPHKGGAKSGRYQRPRLYVPRKHGVGTMRGFEKVVITESEFKCAALWQMIGEGSDLPKENMFGVCGVPGISLIQNVAVWNEIVDFLNEADPSEVIVVFDNEDKEDPKLKGYNEDFEKRFDSDIYARTLVEKISKSFPMKSVMIGRLPDEWRDRNGKADWDGVLARMVSGDLQTALPDDN